MAFGTGPFGYFEAGGAYALPESEERGELSSSRKINTLGQYEVDADGGVVAMDDIAQTVLLTVAYAVTHPKFITPQTIGADRTAVTTALARLSGGRSPAIRLVEVMVEGSGGKITRRITYVNLRTNTQKTVEL